MSIWRQNNIHKTQNFTGECARADLMINLKQIRNSGEGKYSGQILTDEGKDNRDIFAKLSKGTAIQSNQSNSVLWGKNTRNKQKKSR